MKQSNIILEIDNNSKNLVIAFSGFPGEQGATNNCKFDFASSLQRMNIQSDLMFMKDPHQLFFLKELSCFGDTFEDTVRFLRNKCQNYEKVIMIGPSMGGYAAILFGSILKVTSVFAFGPVTDIEGTINEYENRNDRETFKCLFNPKLKIQKKYNKYKNLRNVISEDVKYIVFSQNSNEDFAHGIHQYENIKDFKNVEQYKKNAVMSIKSGELESMITKVFSSSKKYILAPSHLDHTLLKPLETEIKNNLFFKDCEIDSNIGMPNWSNYVKHTLEKNKEKNLIWMVSDYKFNNFDYPKILKLKDSKNLFIQTKFGANEKCVDKNFMSPDHIEILGNHSIKILDYITTKYPNIKLIFWCLYVRTKVFKSNTIPMNLQYDFIRKRYKNNIIDIECYTDCNEFKEKYIRDNGGHPTTDGIKFIDAMINGKIEKKNKRYNVYDMTGRNYMFEFKLDAWYKEAHSELNLNCEKIDQSFAIYPQRFYKRINLNLKRTIDFIFVGAFSFYRPMQDVGFKNRKWVINFAKQNFTSDSFFVNTTKNRHLSKDWTLLGDFDKTFDENFSFLAPKNLPRDKVNTFDEEYFNKMSSSKFCLCPAGDAMFSMRFYEALMCKTIPVVSKMEETYRSIRESELDYKFYFTDSKKFTYNEEWVHHNYNLFLKHHTLEFYNER